MHTVVWRKCNLGFFKEFFGPREWGSDEQTCGLQMILFVVVVIGIVGIMAVFVK